MVLSQLQLACLYYLEFSFKVIILSFLLKSYKVTELQPLWISDSLLWSTKKWKNNINKIGK